MRRNYRDPAMDSEPSLPSGSATETSSQMYPVASAFSKVMQYRSIPSPCSTSSQDSQASFASSQASAADPAHYLNNFYWQLQHKKCVKEVRNLSSNCWS
ncbi:hypothetical protein SK128_001039 [Halocaridina rubra]|uniref:Uncharacterized protein n=1 Tax=Halocaridina rubra TaxID=373956 RepID=A0AAN8WGD2_HALRR